MNTKMHFPQGGGVGEIVTRATTPDGRDRRAVVEVVHLSDHTVYCWYVLEHDPDTDSWCPLYSPSWWPDGELPPLTLHAPPLDVLDDNAMPIRRVNLPTSGGRAGSFSEAMSYCRQWLYA